MWGMRAMTSDYEVGYGKPPKDARCRPEKYGNPNGRPTGGRNVKMKLLEACHV